MYKFRQSFKLDDYSGACVEVLVDADGELSIRAVDLIGDGWWNYLDAVERARQFHVTGDIHRENQEIQRGLTALATHLDGVVCGMCDRLKRELADFRPPARGKRQDCTLAEKIRYVTSYVQQHHRTDLQPLDLTFKVLRDLLIHPYAKKSLTEQDGSKNQVTQGAVYDVTIEELQRAGLVANEWLGRVTEIFEHPRGYDTRRLAESFAARLVTEYGKAAKIELPDKIDATTYRI